MEDFIFESREAASISAADFLASCMERRLEQQRRASFIITGGSSPGRCYEALSEKELDWDRVDIVLSDERWVPADHEDSNERQARQTLMQGNAAAATLHPMYSAEADIKVRVEELNAELRMLPIPFSVALLGMGEDGHFASLFPDANDLESGLSADHPELCMAVNTKASPHPRLSLTMSAISRSDAIVLLIFGEAKKTVIEKAKAGDMSYPVTRLLRQKKAPVHVYWAA
ncbi:MAG: 6-phosphogluconolactonase [Woeseiaceae bacterium]|nr:6-phosphogluconolactonase [Woeseiaceae bacterium]